MKAKPDLDVVGQLRGTRYEDVAENLQKTLFAAGITSKDKLHNAPLKVKTTHGADIYEVIEILKGDDVVEEEEVKGTLHVSPRGTPANPKKVEGTINVMPLIPPATSKKGRK